MDDFFRRGWIKFPHDIAMAEWAAAARPVGQAIFDDPVHRDQWLRCGGTWFAGVNALPNERDGSIPAQDVPALAGAPADYIAAQLDLSGFDWDPAQVSVCLPGYPQPWGGESDAAFRFRRDRDAAHVDGLLRDSRRRRRPGEQHGFVLGIPLTEAPPDGAPFVVYEGSHEIIRQALADRLSGLPPASWQNEDVTDVYTAARREVFASCPRVEIPARPGEAYLAHRLIVHGMAKWRTAATGARMVAYFRPNPFPSEPPDWWLERP